MKQLIWCMTLMAVLCLADAAQTTSPASLAQVKTVYLLPMSHGMDQYLANQLTRGGVVKVATDAAQADALLTDHLGSAFEASVKELYPEPKPEVTPNKTGDDKKESTEETTEAKPDQPDMKSSGAERPAGSNRSRGMVFLVKRGTGEVLWSAYREPGIRRPKDLNRTAGKLAAGLKKAMTPAAPKSPGGK